MRITNRTRNTLLGTKVARASTWWSRLRGFIGRAEPKQGEGLLLVRCDAIHTWWMSFPLDVLFLDDRGKVLQLAPSLPPWKGVLRAPGARYVLEVPEGTIDNSRTEVGDELSWGDPLPYSISFFSERRSEEDLVPHKSRSRAR